MFSRQSRATTTQPPARVNGSASQLIPKRSDEITLGVAASTGEPFTFPRSLLGHMHVRGMSGVGKSSLTLIDLINQLVGFPIFVIDLGGDQNLFPQRKAASR